MELVLWCGLWGVVGLCAANARGWNAVVGFIAGAVLGPLALLLFFVSGVTRKPSAPMKVCSQCAEQVQPAAKVCRFCGNKFDW
jgi:hypothetical protein